MKNDRNKVEWLAHPKYILVIIWTFIALCFALFFADAFYHKHPHFEIEKMFGFYGVYGFFVSVALVTIAKLLSKVVMRQEDYYGTKQEMQHPHNLLRQPHD